MKKDDILGGTLKENLARITEAYNNRNGIKEDQQQFSQNLAGVEEAAVGDTPVAKFLRSWSYHMDHDFEKWYPLWESFAAGDFEEGDPQYRDFEAKTKQVMKRLKLMIRTSF